MHTIRRTFLAAAAVLLAAPLVHAQATASIVNKQLEKLLVLAPEQRQSADIIKVAGDIRTLKVGKDKLNFAEELLHLTTPVDQETAALQAVGDALSQALTESPVPAKKDQPALFYLDLARLVRYRGVKTTLKDPELDKASQILADNDAEVQKADFTLKDMKGKKVTLSELKGKIVVINFWATNCDACQQEMVILDFIYTHYQAQGLVVLSVTAEDPFKVSSFLGPRTYHPSILFDPGGKVAKQFHIATGYHPPAPPDTGGRKSVQASGDTDGLPKSFVFDRKGKLVGQSIDECTQQQFYKMLINTDLQP